jgi:ATP-dependent exoDNAse (exonuclease V) alpha subunit
MLHSNKKIKEGFMKLEYIFVDEVSMVKESFYQILLMLKNSNPKIKFIISGDFYQLPPVNDTINNRSYKHSRALFELVDGNRIDLNICKRSDDTLFNINEKIKKKIDIDISKFALVDDDDMYKSQHICYTNNKRKIINKQLNDYFKEKIDGKGLEIKKLSYDENTQNYTLKAGMPLIARKNDKKLKICNNETFEVTSIGEKEIIVSNETKEIEIPIKSINQLFNLAYCITVHKSQGDTIKNKYIIHEWDKMDYRLKYVSMSRGTKCENIIICK